MVGRSIMIIISVYSIWRREKCVLFLFQGFWDKKASLDALFESTVCQYKYVFSSTESQWTVWPQLQRLRRKKQATLDSNRPCLLTQNYSHFLNIWVAFRKISRFLSSGDHVLVCVLDCNRRHGCTSTIQGVTKRFDHISAGYSTQDNISASSVI